MNQLYNNKYIKKILFKNGKVLNHESYTNLKYGEPKEEIKVSTEWKDLLNEQKYNPEFEGYKNRKGRIWCRVEYLDKHYHDKDIKVYKDEFVSIQINNKIKILNLSDFTINELIKELNAEDFLKVLKDNINEFINMSPLRENEILIKPKVKNEKILLDRNNKDHHYIMEEEY